MWKSHTLWTTGVHRFPPNPSTSRADSLSRAGHAREGRAGGPPGRTP